MRTQTATVEIPDTVVQKWQEIVNLIAEIVNVPAALIMKVEPPNISVFVSSESAGNPYYRHETACLDTGLYCETVMSSRGLLLVPDALADDAWRTNPDVNVGMISYLGFPIVWPNGEIFGTICVLDNKRNEYNTLYQNLLRQFREVVQADLTILFELDARRFSEERTRSVVDHALDAVITIDDAGRIESFNLAAERVFGYPAGEVVGRDIQFLMPESYRAAHEAGMARFLRTGEKRLIDKTVELTGRRKDGSTFPLSLAVSTFSLGDRRYFSGIIRDITERRRAEEELRRAKDAAETANRAKDEFMANVSHEIRTPMNAILGMTDLVLDTPLTEEQRRNLAAVKAGADNLLGIIDDLLDFSKIEAGKFELNSANFSLRRVLDDTLHVLAVRAHQKGLELVGHVQPDVPDALVGDAGRLRQVLLNLVGNAIKFTETGEVVVSVRVEETMENCLGGADAAAADCCHVRFSVRDTGIGISQDKQETIFRAFEQEDTSITRKYGGTGLGLTIAAHLVALMAGTITVKSEPGRGSVFTFGARLARQTRSPGPAAVAAVPPPPWVGDLPVLIVDDNDTSRHVLSEWLSGWNVEPAAVGDGMAAMDALWHRVAGRRPYPLVLLDACMPGSDGFAVAAMIRERSQLASTRIIMLTSRNEPRDPAKIRDLRIDATVAKPVRQDELFAVIHRVMGTPCGVEPTAALPTLVSTATPLPVGSSTSLHILVAEDDELSAMVLEQLLFRQGHRVRLAKNGRDALAVAQRGGFDLLLVDLQMPELDGLHVVQAVREKETSETGHLPVIALTARSRQEDRERCLAAGMDDFLTKPVRPADLWAAIGRVRGNRNVRQTALLDLLDASALLASCGGNATLLRKMCQTLRAHIPGQLATVRTALREQDAGGLRQAAHRIRGTLSQFSTVVSNLAGDLEDLAAGQQLEKAASILERLEAMAGQLHEQVDGLSVESLRDRISAGMVS